MKLIDRHLLRELMAPVIYCLLGFSLIIIIAELFGDTSRILEARPPVALILRYYLSVLGPALQYLAPASLMLATLYTLYGLTRNSELVAMRASGIGIYRIMVPFLAVGLAFSLASAVLSELWVPHAYEWAENMRASRFRIADLPTVQRCIYLNAAARRQWIIERLDTRRPGVLMEVEIKQESPDGHRVFVLTADRAEYLDGQWWFHGPRIQRFGENDNPVGPRVPLGADTNSVVEMRGFNEVPAAFVSAIRKWDYLDAREMLHYIRTHPGMSPRSLGEKSYDLHARLASPWASLIVVLFAIPAGARTGRQGVMSAVFAAVSLMAGFYAMAQVGQMLGSTGAIPPWTGAWLSNLVFGTVGLVMLARLR